MIPSSLVIRNCDMRKSTKCVVDIRKREEKNENEI